MKTAAIVPVKRLEDAKQRLADAVPPGPRKALAEAMLFDVLSHVKRSAVIEATLVVTADRAAAKIAGWLGAEVLLQPGDEGHPEAATLGARWAIEHGFERVAMLPADCPMLDPADLDAHMGNCHTGITSRTALIVPDRHGTGTNALILSPPDVLSPGFGPDSCARHVSRARAAGIAFTVESIDSLGLDLDTPEDLDQLRDALILSPERAPRTAQMIWELGTEHEPSPRTVA